MSEPLITDGMAFEFRDGPDEGKCFVCEHAELTGGSHGHDPYPDAWHVTGRELSNHVYDPKGRLVRFVQDGTPGSHCYNNSRKAMIVGRMEKSYTFIND